VKSVLVCCSLLSVLCISAQAGLRINELQASNARIVADERGSTPDWIELYNPGTQAVDLKGMRVVVAGRQHRFEQSVIVAPKGYLVLWCDGGPERGARHLGFSLPKRGGAVLLVSTDGATILDAFTWKDMPHGVSMARMPDGAASWGYAEDPTPGKPNPLVAQRTERLGIPVLQLDTLTDGSIRVQADVPTGSTLLYTLNGAPVSAEGAMPYTAPLTLAPGKVFRYKAMSAEALPSAEGLVTAPRYSHAERITSLALDPEALQGDSSGIDTPGLFANNTRSGKAWERMAMLDVDGAEPMNVGVRISGSGSRGLAKRSFKVYARNRYDSPAEGLPFPGGSHFGEGILRADASPHAFLRNRLLEVIVQRHGLAVDIQPSTPTALYMNGRYWGLYRWTPPKDAAWVRAISGAEAVDLLSGPGHRPISGSARHFLHARDALLRGAPIDSLAAWMDLNSLVDLACVDLWTGRADHDLNVRCYRPRQPGGRWRWILYDMDLWSPPEENSVERMCSASGPEAPYVPQLLEHPELQQRILARMTALQASAFAPAQATALADSIHAAHEAELLADHLRWDLELGNPPPSAVQEGMQQFIAERPKHLMQHLADHSGRKLRSVVIEVPSREEGTLYLDGCALPPGKQRIRCFSGVPMELKAVPARDVEFVAWKGVPGNGPAIRVDLAQHSHIKVSFRSLVP